MPDTTSLSRSHGQTSLQTAGGDALLATMKQAQSHDPACECRSSHRLLSQVIANAEESLRDFEQRITELKTRGAALQADQISTNKILKLQVATPTALIKGCSFTVAVLSVTKWQQYQHGIMCVQDSYEELVMTVGSRRSGLNQNMALKEQYERALQDLTDLVDTAKDKMAADQRIIASSVEEVQNHLDKHKVGSAGRPVELKGAGGTCVQTMKD